MSRYQKTLENGEQVAWGYDRPLSEYFIQKEDNKGKMEWAVSSYFTILGHPQYPHKTQWTNSELLELFQEFNLPEEHINALGLDLPF